MLSDASHFQVQALMHALHDYMAANMETLLEGKMLDDLTPSLIKQLTEFVRKQQAEKFSVTRSTRMFDRAVENHGEWLALQDIPQPIVRTVRLGPLKESPKLSPPRLNRKNRRLSNASSMLNSPVMRPLTTTHLSPSGPSGDEVFLMDDADVSSTPANDATANQGSSVFLESNVSLKPVPVWTCKPSTLKYIIYTPITASALTINFQG
jgi:hypothetical protein